MSRSKAIWDIITQGLVTAAVFGSFTVIAFMTLNGEISLGDMVMYFMGFQLCVGYTLAIFSSITNLYDDHIFLRDFFQFLDLKPAIAAPENPTPLPDNPVEEIRLNSISFTYPGAQKPALQDISMTIRKGEIIAFVGENGAGKSTLLKLLCRLYLPDTGTITVDDIDMNCIDPEAWRRRLSVIFQDYIRYQLTVEDNIRVGDIERADEPGSIEKSAKKAGADRMVQRFPNGYKTMLGKLFSGGQELSTGEWQKIALSRAFFRDAELILLDEPASSLDALAESEIFKKFREIIQERTAVIISHRFSTVLMADRIYVIERGKIVEHGSHADLLALNGRYAEMFRAQAESYISKSGQENDPSRMKGGNYRKEPDI
jgi:ATP-binding cassette subfamily B protein